MTYLQTIYNYPIQISEQSDGNKKVIQTQKMAK